MLSNENIAELKTSQDGSMLSNENITPVQIEAGQGEKPTDPPPNIRFKERFCSTVAYKVTSVRILLKRVGCFYFRYE